MKQSPLLMAIRESSKMRTPIILMAILLLPYIFASYNAGEFETSNYLSMYIPFDGNISSVFGKNASSINTSSLRINNTPSSVSYSGSLNEATLFYDGDYGTSSYVSQTSCSSQSAEIIINYSRTAADTGMILQKKDDVYNSNGGSSPNEGLMNITIPTECFNYSSSQVSFKILMAASYYAHSTIYYFCLGNSGWQNILSVEASDGSSGSCSSSSVAYLYETSAYISNQSGYTAYVNTNISTILINTLNLSAGYAFSLYNNSQDIKGAYNGNDIGIFYNSSGANFNGTGSIINLSNNIALGDSNQSFTIFVGGYRYYSNSPNSTEHLIGSMAAGWQKGWQVQITPAQTIFLCTNTSGVTGLSMAQTQNNEVDEQTVAVVINNLTGLNCFQESVNQSNQNGNDGNCALNYSGNITDNGFNYSYLTPYVELGYNDNTIEYQSSADLTKFNDGDYGSKTSTTEYNISFIWRYPTTGITSVSYGYYDGTTYNNFTIPAACLLSNNITTRHIAYEGLYDRENSGGGGWLTQDVYCLNTSGGWTGLRTSIINYTGYKYNTTLSTTYSRFMYESYINWNITNYKNVRVYIDGTYRINSERNTTLCNDLWDTNISVTIGMDRNGNNPYNGSIKIVQLFNRTLNDTEILELHNQYRAANNSRNESNSAINLTLNSLILTSNISTPNSTSFWYKNSTGNWRHIVNVSGIYYCNAVNCSKPNDYPIHYTNNKINISNFTGLLDELMIFSYPLSLSEIETLHNGFNSSLNINVRNERTLEQITTPTIDIISDNYSSRKYTSFFNGMPYGILTIRYSAANYPERFYYYNLSSYVNDNLTLYALDNQYSSNISFTLYDNTNDRVTEGYVRMLRYFISDNTYKVVEMIKTNAYGEGIFHAQKDTEFYKFMVYKPFSSLVDTSIPDYIREDSQYIQVNLVDVLGESFDISRNIISSMTFNNATNNFRLDFSNNLAADSNITMKVYKLFNGDKTLINESSTTSSAGTILMPITPQNGSIYLAESYSIINGQTNPLSSNSTAYEYTNPMQFTGLILLFFLAIAAVFIAFYNIGVAIIFISIINLVGVLAKLLPLALLPVSIGIFVIGVFVTILISRD